MRYRTSRLHRLCDAASDCAARHSSGTPPKRSSMACSKGGRAYGQGRDVRDWDTMPCKGTHHALKRAQQQQQQQQQQQERHAGLPLLPTRRTACAPPPRLTIRTLRAADILARVSGLLSGQEVSTAATSIVSTICCCSLEGAAMSAPLQPQGKLRRRHLPAPARPCLPARLTSSASAPCRPPSAPPCPRPSPP